MPNPYDRGNREFTVRSVAKGLARNWVVRMLLGAALLALVFWLAWPGPTPKAKPDPRAYCSDTERRPNLECDGAKP